MILDLLEHKQTYIEDYELYLSPALLGTPVCSRQCGLQADGNPINLLFKTDGKTVKFYEVVKQD